MLKSMCAACAAICLLASPAGAFDIVRDGRAAAVVVVDEKAPASAAKAASEFAAYVGKITGARLEVADAPVAGMATIRVGAPCAAKGTDAISVFVNRKGELEITGREPRGPVYAAYKFLETFGVRYWSPWRETVPKASSLAVRDDFRLDHHPPFDWRSGWSVSDCGDSPAMRAWRVKVGHNGSVPADCGGPYQFTYGETITYRYMKPKDHFGAHPDWYAYVEGRRQPTQLCASSKGGLDAFTAEIRAELQAHPEKRFVSLVSADNDQFCQCPGCRKIRARLKGGNAALEVHIANEIARRLGREFPDVQFTILAYWTKEDAPQNARLEKNVAVGLALGHPHNLPVSKCRVWQQKAAGWEKLARDRLYIWDYYAGFNNFNEPRADFVNIAETMRHYARRGYRGVSAQLALGRTANFGELKAYLWAQFAWDPSRDIDKMIAEYIAANYGAGAPFVQKYWEQNLRLMRTSRDVSMGMYFMNYDKWYRAREMLRAWELVHQALDATEGDEESHRQCELLYVSVLSDFLLRWDRQEVEKEVARHPELKPAPTPASMLAEVEALLRKYPQFYWSEKITWKTQLAAFQEQEAARQAKRAGR